MSIKTDIPTIPLRHKNEICCAPIRPASLGTSDSRSLAGRMKVMGDPTRVQMLDLLAQQDRPMCVCDLTPGFEQNQPTISHHLRLLREAGLVDTEKRGIWAYYWATEEGRRTLSVLKSLL